MTHSTLTLTLPEQLFHRLYSAVQSESGSLDQFVVRALERSLTPPVETDLPDDVQAELNAMAALSDDALWQIAQGSLNRDKEALYDVLLERFHAGELTPEGRQWLDNLRAEADALMLRKAHAHALLQSRGHELPTLDDLRLLDS
jgi:hypothetical protein